MNPADIAVLASAAALIAGVIWFFLVSTPASWFRLYGVPLILMSQGGLVHGVVNERSIALGVLYTLMSVIGILPFLLIIQLRYGSTRRRRSVADEPNAPN